MYMRLFYLCKCVLVCINVRHDTCCVGQSPGTATWGDDDSSVCVCDVNCS